MWQCAVFLQATRRRNENKLLIAPVSRIAPNFSTAVFKTANFFDYTDAVLLRESVIIFGAFYVEFASRASILHIITEIHTPDCERSPVRTLQRTENRKLEPFHWAKTGQSR